MKRIARKRSDVFLRTDLKDLGGYDQVGRVIAVRGRVRRKVGHNGSFLTFERG